MFENRSSFSPAVYWYSLDPRRCGPSGASDRVSRKSTARPAFDQNLGRRSNPCPLSLCTAAAARAPPGPQRLGDPAVRLGEISETRRPGDSERDGCLNPVSREPTRTADSSLPETAAGPWPTQPPPEVRDPKILRETPRPGVGDAGPGNAHHPGAAHSS
jgi:hypothetical protein